MTEKDSATKTGSSPPHGEVGGGNKDSHSSRSPSAMDLGQHPSAVQEPKINVIAALRKNLPGFLYALIVIFVNAFGAILYLLLSKGLIKDFVDLIYLFVKYLFYLIVIADLSALIWGITSIVYKNRSKKEQEDSVDRQVLYGYARLAIFTDEQKKFIKFYAGFGKRKLGNLKRVEIITLKMVDSGNIHQIEKKELEYHLHNYTSSGVFRLSRDKLHIEVIEDLDALMVYAMQVAHEEKARTPREGSINLFLDEKKVRKDSDKWWWHHPYDEVLKNIALIVNPLSVSRIIRQLLDAYKRDKRRNFRALRLACIIAILGVAVENRILKELLRTVFEDVQA